MLYIFGHNNFCFRVFCVPICHDANRPTSHLLLKLCRGLRDPSLRDVMKWKQYLTRFTTVYRIKEGVSKPSSEAKKLLKVVNCSHKIQVKIKFVTCRLTACWHLFLYCTEFEKFPCEFSANNRSDQHSISHWAINTKSFMQVTRITHPIKKKRIALNCLQVQRVIIHRLYGIWAYENRIEKIN